MRIRSACSDGALARLCIAMAALFISALAAGAQEDRPVRQISPDLTPGYQSGRVSERVSGSLKVELPSLERPYGICERGSNDWRLCLTLTRELADRALGDLVERIGAGGPAYEALSPGQRRRWPIALSEINRRFRDFRDYECLQRSLFDRASAKSTYEAKQICILEWTTTRLRELELRYGLPISAP